MRLFFTKKNYVIYKMYNLVKVGIEVREIFVRIRTGCSEESEKNQLYTEHVVVAQLLQNPNDERHGKNAKCMARVQLLTKPKFLDEQLIEFSII